MSLIAYKTLKPFGKDELTTLPLPSRVIVIGNTIYLANVGSQLNHMIKITVTKNLNPGRKCDWTFNFKSDLPEFKHIRDK